MYIRRENREKKQMERHCQGVKYTGSRHLAGFPSKVKERKTSQTTEENGEGSRGNSNKDHDGGRETRWEGMWQRNKTPPRRQESLTKTKSED